MTSPCNYRRFIDALEADLFSVAGVGDEESQAAGPLA